MKTLKTCLFTSLITIIAIPAFAAPKEKKPEATAPVAAKAAGDAKADKPLPMNARVDEIDAKAKTFTQKTAAGKMVKHVVTDKTEIKQGEAAAKFEDIKVGDMVAGLRKKSNADGSEYEVVKITKFGPKAAKDPKEEGEKKVEKKAKE